MCRWLAYSGSPIRLEEFLVKPARSLVDQSLHSRLGATTTNGDGFGVGWYTEDGDDAAASSTASIRRGTTGTCARSRPASPRRSFFAHIRASTGGAIQETNTHPFRHGRWLWMHNGAIREFDKSMHDLRMAVDPDAVPVDRGHDRLRDDVLPGADVRARGRPAGGRRADGRLRRAGRPRPRRRAPDPDDGGDDRRRADLGVPLLQRGPVALAVLQHRLDQLRQLHPEVPALGELWTSPGWSSRSRSATCPAPGTRCRRRSWGVVQPGQDEMHAFQPRTP